jgi:hypothetical protein
MQIRCFADVGARPYRLDFQVADSTSRARKRQQAGSEKEEREVRASTSCVSIRHPSLLANCCDVAPCQIRRKERFYKERGINS